jgi:hypothetical protein
MHRLPLWHRLPTTPLRRPKVSGACREVVGVVYFESRSNRASDGICLVRCTSNARRPSVGPVSRSGDRATTRDRAGIRVTSRCDLRFSNQTPHFTTQSKGICHDRHSPLSLGPLRFGRRSGHDWVDLFGSRSGIVGAAAFASGDCPVIGDRSLGNELHAQGHCRSLPRRRRIE